MEHTQRKTSKQRSRVEREKVVAKWRESGQKVPEFGRKHGIPVSTLYQWIREQRGYQRRKTSAGSRARKQGTPAFAEVKVVGGVGHREPAVTIALPGGHSVTVEGGLVDPGWLGRVLEVMARC